MYCRKCGNEIPDDSVFCAKCGTEQTSISAKKKSESAVVSNISQESISLRIPFLLIAIALAFSPFYKIISVPMGDFFIGLFEAISGYDTNSNTNFSLWSFLNFWGDVQRRMIESNSTNTSGMDFVDSLFFIYGFFWLVSVGGILMMIQKYLQGAAHIRGFWTGAYSSFLMNFIANLSLGIYCFLCNYEWTREVNEYYSTESNVNVKFFSLSWVYYLLLIASFICFIISISRKATAPKEPKKEIDLLKESQFAVVNMFKEKKYFKERATYQADNMELGDNKWVCPNCSQVNDNSKRICIGCGEYK